MSNIVNFQEAAFDVTVGALLSGNAPAVDDALIAQYAAEGVALIQEESGITGDDVSVVTLNGTTTYY